ncbi:MAG: cellulase family glycosylhydrolase [Phycisphaerales bacterium]|nr:cellulase family glycosylhydrolase [Phycisphaerales bacterium]MCB9858771.1 cellulase family glycosylhydrolase [Phycisphaerales bacterium]
MNRYPSRTISMPLIATLSFGLTIGVACQLVPDPTNTTDSNVTTCAECTALPQGWLFTNANRIFISDGNGGGTAFHGRGANLQDTRGCVACLWDDNESPNEVIRRADTLIDDWGANFVRLALESHAEGTQSFAKHYRGILNDAQYFDDIVTIVHHMTSKNVYVLLSLWIDPTVDELGAPTPQTDEVWKKLSAALLDDSHVMFGICNEPEENFDGARDALVWTAMNRAAQTIRIVEDAAGTSHHLILAQGTGAWARRLTYYVDHPITAGGGDNIAYEIHFYNPITDLDELLVGPASKLPVIIGEFGPISDPNDVGMSLNDCQQLMDYAMQEEIPFLAWTFHQNCPPNLIENDVGEECGIGMDLRPTQWGSLLQEYLAKSW